jgi:hypothetical protein
MTQEEQKICIYLRSMPGQFVSARDIARRADGKARYGKDPRWAAPIIAQLLEQRIIETDSTHHYRLIIKEQKKPKKWVSPQVKKILEKSGKDFTHVIEDKDLPPDFFEDPK